MGPAVDTYSAAAPLVRLLRQLAGVLEGLADSSYRAEQARGVSGSIGSHVRHCLDHVDALLTGLPAGRVDYDARRRGTTVESSRAAAIAETIRLCRALDGIRGQDLDQPLVLAGALDTNGPQMSARSSVGRELAFVVSHTIHHLAVIALLLRELGIAVPPRFGYAPSTPTPATTAA
ncbi:MAG TPA: DinB family protein [Vicinamibacterales bacterium]|nr:DinB family protein [Vicinamibacterales bacterium]